VLVSQRRIPNGKLKRYTIDSSKHCGKNERKIMIMVPRRYEHRSSGANIPSDVAVTVNINAEFNLSLI